MSEPTPEQNAQLTAMHKDWDDAEKRAAASRQNLALAQQTVAGAEAEALSKQARFKGAAEVFYGSDWSFDYKDGRLTFIPPELARKQSASHGPGKRKKR